MAFVTINEKVCKGCGLCVFSCPKKVLELSEHKLNANGYPVAEARPHGGLHRLRVLRDDVPRLRHRGG